MMCMLQVNVMLHPLIGWISKALCVVDSPGSGLGVCHSMDVPGVLQQNLSRNAHLSGKFTYTFYIPLKNLWTDSVHVYMYYLFVPLSVIAGSSLC